MRGTLMWFRRGRHLTAEGPGPMESTGVVAVVEFEGELDMANHEALRVAVERERADDREIIVIDLSACTYLDSTAIQELINLSNELRRARGRLVLVVPPKPSGRRRLFQV